LLATPALVERAGARDRDAMVEARPEASQRRGADVT
jgi:hypothetical protein